MNNTYKELCNMTIIRIAFICISCYRQFQTIRGVEKDYFTVHQGPSLRVPRENLTSLQIDTKAEQVTLIPFSPVFDCSQRIVGLWWLSLGYMLCTKA